MLEGTVFVEQPAKTSAEHSVKVRVISFSVYFIFIADRLIVIAFDTRRLRRKYFRVGFSSLEANFCLWEQVSRGFTPSWPSLEEGVSSFCVTRWLTV